MDFLDPNKKRAHKIRLYLGYALMAVAIGLGAVILLYAAYGYSVDRQGNVFQNGLVFVASTPDAAEVKITNQSTNQSQKAITSDRLVLPAGKYAFEFLKQGYRPWQRTLELKGGGIQRLVYPFLFPEELQPEDVGLYSSEPGFASVTPDRATIVVQRPGSMREFDVYDADDTSKTSTSFTLPEDLFTPAENTQKTELVEWSSDGESLLVKHTYGKKSEYAVIDRVTPANSVNINALFKVTPKEVTLRDKKADKLYIHQSDNTLLTADTDAKTTNVVVKNALAFRPHGDDTLLYIAKNSDVSENNVGVFVLDNGETYKLREVPESPGYLLDLAKFNDNWLVAAGATKDSRIYVYRNPVSVIKANKVDPAFSIRTMRIEDPQFISFSANAQFLAVQSGQSFDVYDALDDRQHHFTIGTKFDKDAGKATWMDGHRLLTSTKGKVTVLDFDGSNYQILTAISPGTVPMLNSDYSAMFAIAPSVKVKSRTALVMTPLRVETN